MYKILLKQPSIFLGQFIYKRNFFKVDRLDEYIIMMHFLKIVFKYNNKKNYLWKFYLSFIVYCMNVACPTFVVFLIE